MEQEEKLTLNSTKSESTFFSTDTHESKWAPTLNIGGAPVSFNPSPKLLGVHLDRTLAFSKHVSYVTNKVATCCRTLSCLSSKTWGWNKETMKRVYTSNQRSVMDYAAAAWQPYLSATQAKQLDTAQNKALRIITGQYASTPTEALRLEAGVESYATRSKKLCMIASEKAKRLAEDHPRRIAWDHEQTHRPEAPGERPPET